MKIIDKNEADIQKLTHKLRREDANMTWSKEEALLKQRQAEAEEKLMISEWCLTTTCDGYLYHDEKVTDQFTVETDGPCSSNILVNIDDLEVYYDRVEDYNGQTEEVFIFYFVCPVCGNFTEVRNEHISEKIQTELLKRFKAQFQLGGIHYGKPMQNFLVKKIEATQSIRDSRRALLEQLEKDYKGKTKNKR